MRKKSVWLVLALAFMVVLERGGTAAVDVISGPAMDAVDAIGAEMEEEGNVGPAAGDSWAFVWEWLRMQWHHFGFVGGCGIGWSHRSHQ